MQRQLNQLNETKELMQREKNEMKSEMDDVEAMRRELGRALHHADGLQTQVTDLQKQVADLEKQLTDEQREGPLFYTSQALTQCKSVIKDGMVMALKVSEVSW